MAREQDSIARNTVFAFAVQVTGAAFTGALTLYLVRALGPSQYGLFVLALGISLLLVLPADLGISAATARFAAEQRGDQGAIASLLAHALRLKLLGAAAVSGALFAAAGPIADAYNLAGLAWPLRGMAVSLFGQSLMMLFAGTFVALGKVSRNLVMAFGESAVEVGTSVALVALGAGATGAAFGRAAGFMFGALIGALLVLRGLSSRAFARRGARRARQIGRYAGALFVIDGAFTLFNQIDILLIGTMLGAASVGLFQAPLRMVTLMAYPAYALAAGVAPRMARHRHERQRVDAFSFALRWVTIFQAALIAPVVVWATPLTALVLGTGYGESASVLRTLAPYVFLSGLAPLVSVTANYLGEARRRVPIAVTTVLVNLVLDLVLIPRIGIVGGAIGTDVAFLVYVPAQVEICRRLLDLPLRPIAVTLGRCALAAGAMALVLAAAGTSSLTLGQAILGSIGGLGVFVAVLVGTRELSGADLRFVRSISHRMAPALPGGRG